MIAVLRDATRRDKICYAAGRHISVRSLICMYEIVLAENSNNQTDLCASVQIGCLQKVRIMIVVKRIEGVGSTGTFFHSIPFLNSPAQPRY